MQTLDQINQDYVSCKRKPTLVEEINASLYSQDNYKLKKQYTSNQKLLAQHKINVQDSLGEVRQEMQDILKHLKNEDNSLELRHIHRMAEIIPEVVAITFLITWVLLMQNASSSSWVPVLKPFRKPLKNSILTALRSAW